MRSSSLRRRINREPILPRVRLFNSEELLHRYRWIVLYLLLRMIYWASYWSVLMHFWAAFNSLYCSLLLVGRRLVLLEDLADILIKLRRLLLRSHFCEPLLQVIGLDGSRGATFRLWQHTSIVVFTVRASLLIDIKRPRHALVIIEMEQAAVAVFHGCFAHLQLRLRWRHFYWRTRLRNCLRCRLLLRIIFEHRFRHIYINYFFIYYLLWICVY